MKKGIILTYSIICCSIVYCQNVGIGTTTPFARLHVADSNVVFTGPASLPGTTTYNPPIQGAGTRMMWYPQKAAFRVGNVDADQWDKNNIGRYSFASGNNNTASGESSSALGGYNTTASGVYSTTIGNSTIASGNSSTALGVHTLASGINSTAMGIYTTASGGSSTAFGNNSTASGESSTAFGVSNTASGIYTTAIGINTTASGNFSMAMGYQTVANSFGSLSLGSYNDPIINTPTTTWISSEPILILGNSIDQNNKSNALVVLKNGKTGIGTSAPTEKLEVAGKTKTTDLQVTNGAVAGKILMADAIGNANWQSLPASAIIWNTSGNNINNSNTGNVGIGTTTPVARLHVADSNVVFSGPATVPATTTYDPPIQGSGTRMLWYPQKAAFRVGYVNGSQWDKINIGKYSFASGNNSAALGDGSTALGNNVTAAGNFSTAMGYNAIASAAGSTAIGAGITASGLESTAIGSGTTASNLQATAMGGFTTASGYGSTSMGLNTIASGDGSIALGYHTTAKSFVETAIGAYNTDYSPLSTSGSNPADRLFVIGNGTNSNATSDAMVVLKNGNTGIGTTSPTYKLHIGSSASGLRVEGPAVSGGIALSIGGFGDLQIDKPNNAGGRFIVKDNGSVGIGNNNPGYKLDVTGDINASGNVRANGVILSSDARFKQKIGTIPHALNSLMQLRGINYFFNREAFPNKNFTANKQMGVIAQEVENIFPELVCTDNEGFKSVNYIGLIPVMIESIKEQQQQINQQQQQIDELMKLVRIINK